MWHLHFLSRRTLGLAPCSAAPWKVLLLKKIMCQSRLLPYEYFTQKFFLLGCIQRQTAFKRPKDMADPVVTAGKIAPFKRRMK